MKVKAGLGQRADDLALGEQAAADLVMAGKIAGDDDGRAHADAS